LPLLDRLENPRATPATEKLKRNAYRRALQEVIAQQLDPDLLNPEKEDDLRRALREITDNYFAGQSDVPPGLKDGLLTEVLDEMVGFGPLTQTLHDPEISEVMVNGPDQVYVERHGKLELTPVRFADADQLRRVIDKIVAPLGRRIDESSPMVDARLPDGSRVNAVIPPLAINGPVLTIRKFGRNVLGMEDLVKRNTLSAPMARFLSLAVAARLNVVVAGGTGSGKTTTLNCLSGQIPDSERIVTIEDAAELKLQQPHVVSMETRPANLENRGEVTIRDLVRNSLRMRPDRIIVGEVRGGEALDMLQAMNTGHDGSLTTVHANSPRDTLARVETMVLLAGIDLPLRAIREQVVSAFDIIVYQARFRDGSRRITHITEVVGLEGDTVVLQDLFRYELSDGGRTGRFGSTGLRPVCLQKLHDAGLTVPDDLFSGGAANWK
jgi:pilus assembly protein CpaF